MLSYGGTEISQLKVNWNGGCCFAIWLAAWLPCSLSELPGRLPAAPWQLLCLSFACLSPVFRLCFAIGTLTPVFRYRSPHPGLPSRCLPMSAGFCRQNPDSTGRTGQNPDSARILLAEPGRIRILPAEPGRIRILPGFRRQNPVHICSAGFYRHKSRFCRRRTLFSHVCRILPGFCRHKLS